jgi:signal transduction histidine kinase
MLREVGQGTNIPATSVQQMVSGISKGADRLEKVIEAMLDVSLIEADAFAVQPEPVSLKYIVERVLDGLDAALRERQQTATQSGLDDLPDIVADAARLQQALHNVVINSVKYTPDGGRIDIRAKMVQRGDAIELAISDTGIGIDPEHQALIFEKFYRVGDLNLHSSGQTKFKGAGPGLGLPIAKGIVEAQGGRIWVESEGCDEQRCPGSTFYIVLPLGGAAQPVPGSSASGSGGSASRS